MSLEIEPPPGVQLRPARPADRDFARKLYLESMEPLLTALGTWDEPLVTTRFERAYRSSRSQVICADGDDIGWLQISQSGSSIHLDQVHLVKRYRNRGIGSRLIRAAMETAEWRRLPLNLNVVRGNPAIALYLRLGFRVVDEDQELFRMCWNPLAGRDSPRNAPLGSGSSAPPEVSAGP
jgi:GNAT superfamily N-acetyltransferase